MSEFNPKDPAQPRDGAEHGTGAQAIGATGIFGALQTPSATDAGLAAAAEYAAAAPQQPFPAILPRSTPPPVVVHEVKFQAQGADEAAAAAPLQRLMQSQSVAGGENAAATGGFTQLLSTLQIPSPEPAAQGTTQASVQSPLPAQPPAPTRSPAPVLSSGLSAVPQASSSGPYPVLYALVRGPGSTAEGPCREHAVSCFGCSGSGCYSGGPCASAGSAAGTTGSAPCRSEGGHTDQLYPTLCGAGRSSTSRA